MEHIPVMVKEILHFLDPKPNQNFVDCTLGDGGHALSIMGRISPGGCLLGIDADPEAVVKFPISNFQFPNLKKRLILVNGNFRNLEAIVKEQKFGPAQGILIDLGFSSSTLERGRGFSFEKDELLDMRFNVQEGIRAAEIVNGWNQQQLAELLQEYGEERLAFEIADKIVAERKIEPVLTTKQLADVVCATYKEKLKSKNEVPWIGGLHPATKTFQALRIAVNDELNALQEVLPQAVDLLVAGGRLAVIAFHSLEDRIVKHFFREISGKKIKLVTKKPIYPSSEEIKNNPKARSAKMRVAEK